MRAYYFTEMPYPFYPPEVAQEIHSQRVIMPNRYCDPVVASDLYNRYLDEFEYADELGLDIMLNEHHQTPTCLDSVMPLSAAALARRTKQAKILLLGTPIVHRDNPVRVAEELAFLDCVSRGRLICGLIRGVPTECHPANTNPALTRERFEEAHDLIMAAWATQEPFNWEGRFWHYRFVNPWPRPYQQPHPPIWVTGTSLYNIPWIADHQYVHACFLQRYEEQEELHRVYRERCLEQHLPEPTPDKFAFLALVYVADTEERAREEGQQLMWYLRSVSHPGFNNPPGFNPPEAIANAYLQTGPRRAQGLDWEGLREKGIAIWGTPDSVVKQIRYLHERCDVGHLICMMQAGFMPTEHTRRSLKLFAEEVFPAIRHLGEAAAAPARTP